MDLELGGFILNVIDVRFFFRVNWLALVFLWIIGLCFVVILFNFLFLEIGWIFVDGGIFFSSVDRGVSIRF